MRTISTSWKPFKRGLGLLEGVWGRYKAGLALKSHGTSPAKPVAYNYGALLNELWATFRV